MKLYWIDPESPADNFPDTSTALTDPSGLLAFGGDLSPERLIHAYRNGIFPWFNENEPIMWWSPNPRSVLFPENIRLSRSLRKKIRGNKFTITFDEAFSQVIYNCAAPRDGHNGTWITQEMMDAYIHLHELGHAHSVEAWLDDQLVGGLYGIFLGDAFFGESMFSNMSDASKICFATLVKQLSEWNVKIIDCQISSEHLNSLGACDISRDEFTAIIQPHTQKIDRTGKWIITDKDST